MFFQLDPHFKIIKEGQGELNTTVKISVNFAQVFYRGLFH